MVQRRWETAVAYGVWVEEGALTVTVATVLIATPAVDLHGSCCASPLTCWLCRRRFLRRAEEDQKGGGRARAPFCGILNSLSRKEDKINKF